MCLKTNLLFAWNEWPKVYFTYASSQSHNRDPSKCTSDVFLASFSPLVLTVHGISGHSVEGCFVFPGDFFLASATKAGTDKSPRPVISLD